MTIRYRRRPAGRALFTLLGWIVLSWCAVALAQATCLEELEPNDAPGSAVVIGGARCLVGELPGNDQDAWVWEVTEDDATTEWTLRVEGIPSQLTRVDLIDVGFAEDGSGVADAEPLLTHGTRDGTPATSPPFLVTPGQRLFLGVSKSGGEGSYILQLEPGGRVSSGRRPLRTLERQGAFGAFGTLEDHIELTWVVTDEDSLRRWGLVLTAALGATVEADVLDPSGAEVGSLRAGSGVGRLDALGLAAGTYTIRLRSASEGPGAILLDAEPQGVLTDGDEVEPNDRYEDANVLVPGEEVGGGGGDSDYYRIAVDAGAAGRAWDLTLDADGRVDLQLRTADRELLFRRSGTSGVVPALHLDAGVYWLIADGARDAQYTLTLSATGVAQDEFEREPNDELLGATPLPENLGVRGRLGPQDVDVFRFATEGVPQLFRFQAIGDGAGELTVYNGGGVAQQSLRGEGRIRLDNIVLLPGTHYVSVGRGEGDYALRALPLGPAPEPEAAEPTDPDVPLGTVDDRADAPGDAEATEPADDADHAADAEDAPTEPDLVGAPPPPPAGRVEHEPNDDESRSSLLEANVVHVGQLPEGDADVYRFFLAQDGRVRVELQHAGDTFVELFEDRDGRVLAREGGGVAFEASLLAGDYFVRLRPTGPVDGYYRLRLAHLDPFAAPVDDEPNDALARASGVPSSGLVEGRLDEGDRSDWYALPEVPSDTLLTLSVTTASARATLLDATTGSGIQAADSERNGETTASRFQLPAGTRAAVRMTGSGEYRVLVGFDDPPAGDAFRPMPGGHATVEPSDASIPVAAYWHLGQVVETSLTLSHSGDSATTYRLVAHASSPDARVELPETVPVDAGGSVEVPVTIRLLDDLRDDAPLRVTIGAIDTNTFATMDTGRIQLDAACSAAPVAPQRVWPLPTILLGSFDVAQAAFGATLGQESLADLIDGRTAPARGEHLPLGEPVTVRLAGGAPQRLTGAILHPYGRTGPGSQVERFRIEASTDGVSFTTVLEGTLGTARREQTFAFEAPVEATHARFVPLSAHGGGDRASLGEWKLLAADPPMPEINLLDAALGGQVAWANVDPTWLERSLTSDGDGDVARGGFPADLEWVLGFHHGRAAQIERLEWIPNPDDGDRIHLVEVSVSTTSPAGPFAPLGTWNVDEGAWTLVAPVWARYLRFVAPARDGAQPRRILFPDAIVAYERAPDAEYRSVVGEWGDYRREATFEWSQGVEASSPTSSVSDAGDDRASATLLPPGDVATGTVAVAEDADWYRLAIPPGDNLLEVVLEGAPTVDFAYALWDADGAAVHADMSEDEDGRMTLRAFVEVDEVFLELVEPKRSVIFAWDTSGSVSPYQAITYNSLARFARDVDPEREFVQLLAYDSPSPIWLLPYWSGDPLRVQRAIQEFDRNAESSDSFTAMVAAAEALAQRDGTRAILLMTDAETGGFALAPRLWAALQEARPRVFSFEISSAGSDWTQDLMQTWAAVNEGHYAYARNIGDFDVGFRRAACQLRRPKAYRVEVATRAEEPPGPGALAVVPGSGAPEPAVEVILDASGSMGVLLPDGTPRIDAARATLQALVRDVLKESTPFALRAFGHVMPSTCDQELVVPLAPLDREEALQAIAGIEPKLLSQTPIADALRAAAEDLASADGPVAVVLITDGEESCGGDPEAALSELRAAGIDVTLSIVSLALDDAAAEERFAALAELGGGAYADVGDPRQLGEAIEASLAVPFEVLAPDGTVVARGSVGGDAVSVPAGLYTVRVAGSPPTLLRDVRVPGDARVEVPIGR